MPTASSLTYFVLTECSYLYFPVFIYGIIVLESALLVLGVNSADYAEEYFQRNRL